MNVLKTKRPSSALVVAMIALFVALGGTAGAVVNAAVPLAKHALLADNARKLGRPDRCADRVPGRGRNPGPASTAAGLVSIKTGPGRWSKRRGRLHRLLRRRAQGSRRRLGRPERLGALVGRSPHERRIRLEGLRDHVVERHGPAVGDALRGVHQVAMSGRRHISRALPATALALLLLLLSVSSATTPPSSARSAVGSVARVIPVSSVTPTEVRVADAAESWTGGPTTSSTGETVTVFVSSGLPAELGTPQSWADFFAGLVHGPELPALTAYIAPLSEVQQVCGPKPLAATAAIAWSRRARRPTGSLRPRSSATSTATTSPRVA